MFWLGVVAVLFVASIGAHSFLASPSVVPSAVRTPLSAFAWPGVTVWWFTLGGPFQSAPHSHGGIAFAAAANAAVWSALAFVASAVVRRLLRAFAA